MRLPPVSKFSVISLLIFSTTVAFYRYYTYFVIVSQINNLNQSNENPSQPSLRLPRPDEIYVPLLTLIPPSGTSWSFTEDSSNLKTNGFSFYPWVLITSSLVETNIIQFLLAFITLLYGARYCENIWGSSELARFLIILSTIPNLLIYIFYTFMHWMIYRNRTINEDPSFDSFKETICGTTAVIAGFLVAFKQLVPEHMIVMFKGRIRLRVKRLPFLFIVTNLLAGILGYGLVSIMTIVGFMTSWVYLRFIRISYVDPLLPFTMIGSSNSSGTTNSAITASSNSAGSNSSSSSTTSTIPSSTSLTSPNGIKVRGDASDSFSLATFFPEPFSFLVEIISDYVYLAFTSLHIISPFTPEEVDNANSRAIARLVPGGITGPSSRSHRYHSNSQQAPSSFLSSPYNPNQSKYPRGSTRAEAERRRSLALRALGQDLPLPSSELSAPNPVVLPAPRAGRD